MQDDEDILDRHDDGHAPDDDGKHPDKIIPAGCTGES